jgi:hypothetical protein
MPRLGFAQDTGILAEIAVAALRDCFTHDCTTAARLAAFF